GHRTAQRDHVVVHVHVDRRIAQIVDRRERAFGLDPEPTVLEALTDALASLLRLLLITRLVRVVLFLRDVGVVGALGVGVRVRIGVRVGVRVGVVGVDYCAILADRVRVGCILVGRAGDGQYGERRADDDGYKFLHVLTPLLCLR